MHWELSGTGSDSGPRLLYCNGSGSTIADITAQLALIGDGFELLSFDYRGLGGATPPQHDFTMTDIAADIAALLDHVGWRRARVVGISFGGMVAQEFAVTHPDRVERLALIVTSAGGAGGSSYPLHTLAGLTPAERAARMIELIDRRWTPDYLAAHRADRLIVQFETERMATPRSPADETAFAAQLRARATYDVWDRLPAIDCPTWVASGRYDGIAPPANGAAIASRIEDAEFHLYDGGHALLFQVPQAQRDLRAFLR